MAIPGLLGGYNEQRNETTNYLATLDKMRLAQLAQQLEQQRAAAQQQQFGQELGFRQQEALQRAQQAQQTNALEQARLAQNAQQFGQTYGLNQATGQRAQQELNLKLQEAARSAQGRNALQDLLSQGGEVDIANLGRAVLPYDTSTGINLLKASKEEQRQQALLDRTGGTGIAPPAGYRWTKEGNLEAIPGGSQDPAVLAQLEAIKTRPSGGGSEDERKAAGWLAQATNAYNNMARVAQASPSASAPGILEAAASGIGAEGLSNMLRSPNRQQFVQAASSFSEAALRAATGAGVNKDEAKQKIQELTPQYTDDLPVRQQKLESMKVYLDSLQARAGRASTSFIPERAAGIGQSSSGQPSSQQFNSLPDPRQYVGKTFRNPETGMRMTSTGSDWVRAE